MRHDNVQRVHSTAHQAQRGIESGSTHAELLHTHMLIRASSSHTRLPRLAIQVFTCVFMSVVNPSPAHNAVAKYNVPPLLPVASQETGYCPKRKAPFHSRSPHPSYSPWGLLALGMSANIAVPLAASTFLVLVFLKSVWGLDLHTR
jgi:hypothetical protein